MLRNKDTFVEMWVFLFVLNRMGKLRGLKLQTDSESILFLFFFNRNFKSILKIS